MGSLLRTTMGSPLTTKPEERVDLTRTVLMPPDQYGQRFRAKIIERVDDYHKGLDNEREKNPHYKVLVGHEGGEPWEEIVAYNDLCNLIHDDDATDGIWKFRKILSYQGPLTKKDPMYKEVFKKFRDAIMGVE